MHVLRLIDTSATELFKMMLDFGKWNEAKRKSKERIEWAQKVVFGDMLEEGNANGVKKRQRPILLSEDVLDQFSLDSTPSGNGCLLGPLVHYPLYPSVPAARGWSQCESFLGTLRCIRGVVRKWGNSSREGLKKRTEPSWRGNDQSDYGEWSREERLELNRGIGAVGRGTIRWFSAT